MLFFLNGQTAFCRNAEKGCVHMNQSGRTLHKRELRALGCPILMAKQQLCYCTLPNYYFLNLERPNPIPEEMGVTDCIS
jgi:hypothetical protein